MIHALIPLGLRADGHAGISRWGTKPGSIFLADQKLAIAVPHVRDCLAQRAAPLATYQQLQTPTTRDVGLFRRVLGGLSCREYETAAAAVPAAFGLVRSSVSRRFIRASAHELRRLQERRLDDAEWLVLVLDGKTFAGDQLVVALGVTAAGEQRILGLGRAIEGLLRGAELIAVEKAGSANASPQRSHNREHQPVIAAWPSSSRVSRFLITRQRQTDPASCCAPRLTAHARLGGSFSGDSFPQRRPANGSRRNPRRPRRTTDRRRARRAQRRWKEHLLQGLPDRHGSSLRERR